MWLKDFSVLLIHTHMSVCVCVCHILYSIYNHAPLTSCAHNLHLHSCTRCTRSGGLQHSFTHYTSYSQADIVKNCKGSDCIQWHSLKNNSSPVGLHPARRGLSGAPGSWMVAAEACLDWPLDRLPVGCDGARTSFITKQKVFSRSMLIVISNMTS